MNLTPAALNTLAECISRNEYVTVEFNGVIESEVWCNGCMEHSAITFAMKGMSEKGTYDLGELTWCSIHDRNNE